MQCQVSSNFHASTMLGLFVTVSAMSSKYEAIYQQPLAVMFAEIGMMLSSACGSIGAVCWPEGCRRSL